VSFHGEVLERSGAEVLVGLVLGVPVTASISRVRNAPFGRSFLKKTLGTDVMMCRCLLYPR